MPYDYPTQRTGDTARDVAALWDSVWKLVERLNISEDELRTALKERAANDQN